MSDKEQSNTRDIYQIAGLKEQPMKTYIERIDPGNDDRIKYLYEALKNATGGSKCLVTVYVYNTASDEPSFTQEDEAIWNGAWDTQDDIDAQADGYTLKGFNTTP